ALGDRFFFLSVAGHLFLLSCQIADAHSEIKWSRGDGGDGSLPAGVEVRDGSLWFLPVQMTHSGSYVCEKRNKMKPSKGRFRVLVSGSSCPDPSEEILATKETSEGLPCKQNEIFRLNLPRKIRWTKDCQQVQSDGDPVHPNTNGLMRLADVSEADAGKYTCHVDVTVDGRNYTAARSVQMTVKNGTICHSSSAWFVCYFTGPPGKRAELHCKAYTGFSEDEEIFMYWTINGTYSSDIISPSSHVVVSAMLSLDGVACFALRVLPEELEQKHGYSLYIRGRDDRPGEAIHDVISAAVRQCRRLLIVLSSAGKSKETAQFWENPNQLTYEQKVGLHDALMRNDPKVILVEVDGPVDYSQLPESLRYIKRTQGALEWKSSFVETNKLTQMYLKSNFWKSLRRHMPAAPARRPQSIA
uniref:Uncharacterized protein n=1 Tax=Xiphophorus couchianus TaxID=32473 RepID=A0A3B5LK97_9TELE